MTDDHVLGNRAPSLQFDEWEALFQATCDTHVHLEKPKRKSFTGWVQPVSLCGLPALDLGCSEMHFERTRRHVQLGCDDYVVVLQLVGDSVVFQNDRTIDLAPGDLALVNSTRPGQRVQRDHGRSFGFRLPRRLVVSHLGYEPQGGRSSRGMSAGRLIFQLAIEAIRNNNQAPTSSDAYMQLAICDLSCALFAEPDNELQSRHTEKLFAQVCSIIRDRFTDPDLSPSEVAAEARISLRYLQKLFTPKGTTCIHFIHSLRLDHAARLLHRRALIEARKPLNEIALACGFRDYTFFSRKFRERFGCVPSSYAEGD